MITPQRETCDFCPTEITDLPHTHITIPLSPAMRREMLEYLEEHVAPRFKSSPLGAMMPMMALIPGEWTISQCLKCTEGGFMPNAISLVAKSVKASILAKIDLARRQEETAREMDEVDG